MDDQKLVHYCYCKVGIPGILRRSRSIWRLREGELLWRGCVRRDCNNSEWNEWCLAMAAAAAALMAFKKAQPDPGRQLANWLGNDPCALPRWNGIYCDPADSSNVSHVIEMYEILTLPSCPTSADLDIPRFYSFFYSPCPILYPTFCGRTINRVLVTVRTIFLLWSE